MWCLINGTNKQPDASDVKGVHQWKVNNVKIISWILGYVDTNIGISIKGFCKVKETWEYLAMVYKQSNLTKKLLSDLESILVLSIVFSN